MSNLDSLPSDALDAAPHLTSILASGHYTSVSVYTIRPRPVGSESYGAYNQPCDGTYGAGKGAVLLAIIPTKVVMTLPRNGMKYDEPDKHQLVDVITLVFGTKRDEALREACERADHYFIEAGQAAEKLAKAEAQQAALAKEVAQIKSQLEASRQGHQEADRLVKQHQASLRKIEQDLAKARSHFGSKAFDEAIKG